METNLAYQIWKQRLEAGDKHIALSNMGHTNTQQKYLTAMLALISKDSKMYKKKVGLVSFNLEHGLYENYFNPYTPFNRNNLKNSNVFGSDFINWHFLINKNIPIEILEEYDLLLWDLPDLGFISSHAHSLNRFFNLFESMLIVSLRPNGVEDQEYIKRTHDFYKMHGLHLPQIVDTVAKISKPNKDQNKLTEFVRRVVGI